MTERQDDAKYAKDTRDAKPAESAKEAKGAEYPKKMYREDHYAPPSSDVKVVNSKTEEAALGPGWSDKPKEVKDGQKDVREYPRSMYNKDEEIKVVNSKEEESALGPGWKDGFDHGQAKLKQAEIDAKTNVQSGMKLEEPRRKAS